jgi:subtilase family serine protease
MMSLRWTLAPLALACCLPLLVTPSVAASPLITPDSARTADTAPAANPAPPEQRAPDPSTPITFFVGLPFDSAGLSQQARDVSDPVSAAFGLYLSPRQIAGRFGATAAAETALAKAARSAGLQSAIDPTRMFARLTGTVATWEKLIGIPVQYVTAETSVFFGQAANDTYVFTPKPQIDIVDGVPVPTPEGLTGSDYSPAPAALARAVTWFLPVYEQYVPAADTTPSATQSASARNRARHSIHGLTFLDTGNTPVTPLPTNTGTPIGTSCIATNDVAVAGLNGPTTQEAFFTPDQVSQAYGLTALQHRYGAAASGDVAIISLNGGFLQSDLQNSANCFGYRAPTIDIRRGTGVNHPFVNVDDETSLDLQTVAWTLKNAKAIRLVEVTNGATSFLDGYSRALTDPRGAPAAISLSYGECDFAGTGQPGSRATESLFQAAGLAGTSLFVASGDLGSSTCQEGSFLGTVQVAISIIEHIGEENVTPPLLDYLQGLVDDTLAARAIAIPTVSYPASSPWVTAVGATQLILGKANAIESQAVWNDLQYYGQPGNLVSTGGSSTSFAAPWYQLPLRAANRRVVPDVSLLGASSPGMAISVNGQFFVTGGTSQASPFMASALALVGRARGQHLGFINPWLYDLGQRTPRAFLDVELGDNQFPVPLTETNKNVPACCQAEPGFDPASGLGAPNFGGLVNAGRGPIAR